MSTLEFLGFRDSEPCELARVETAGGLRIPLNIHIDNAADVEPMRPGPCRIDVCAIGYDIQIFDSETAYLAQKNTLALPALIPVGTFSLDGDESFEESPEYAAYPLTGKYRHDSIRTGWKGEEGALAVDMKELIAFIKSLDFAG